MTSVLSSPTRIARINAIVVAAAITWHWIPNYWTHCVAPLFSDMDPVWAYHLSLVLLGVLLTVWAPRSFGIGFGQSFREWRAVVVFAVVMILPAVGVMGLLRLPFYGSSRSSFVCVPLFEELIFRGFLFAVIADVYPRAWSFWRSRISTATLLTAIAFGFWHLGGFRLPQDGFYWFQVVYTTAAGFLIGVLRDRTGSIWPGWAIHFFVDWWAVTIPGLWDSK